MQQIFDTRFSVTGSAKTGLVYWIGRRWDLLVVLALMALSLAYGLFAFAPAS